jgi:glycosyltransferase involved in cell wall biosynthesis
MKALLFANTGWYLYNFRLPLAKGLRDRGWEVILVSPYDDYCQKLMKDGFRWVNFPLSRKGLNPFIELWTVFSLVRFYLHERPDAAQHFTIKCILYGTLAAKLSGVPRIINAVTGMGYAFSRDGLIPMLLRFFLRGIYRPILRKTEVIFQNGDDLNHYLKSDWIVPAQAHLIPGSGVDMEKFKPALEPQGDVTVLFASRMLWPKGIQEFIDAARILQTENIMAQFVLVGDTDPGNPEAVPLETLKAWEAEGIVKWWGWADNMPSIYQKVHIVCLPSYYREGVPRTLIEASAAGRPLVTTDTPGCRDVVRPGKNGLLVPAHDPQALADALKILILDADLRKRLGACGRSIALREYSLPIILEKTLLLYT